MSALSRNHRPILVTETRNASAQAQAGCSRAVRMLCVAIALMGGTSLSQAEQQSLADNQVAKGEVQNGPTDPAQKVDVRRVAGDQEIAQRLTRILNASRFVNNAEVSVEEGIVFLKGKTEDEKYSQWAANVARNTQDVVAVVNNIQVSEVLNLSESVGHVSTSLQSLWRDLLKRLPLILCGGIVVLATWLANKFSVSLVRRMAAKSRVRISLRDLLAQLTTFFVWLFGIMVAAIVVFPGMTPAKLLTVLGLSSVAIGFAFKDIFENFFAGVLILWRFPFDKGDFIECGEIAGKVEDITIRMTEIRQVDGQLVVVPNAMLFKQPVQVLTNSSTRRVTVICGVGYGESIEDSRKVIHEAVASCESVDSDRPIEIFAREFADSSINFEVTWWTGSTPLDIRTSRDQVVQAVKTGLDKAGIEIPFPHRTLTFSAPLSVEKPGRQDPVIAESRSANSQPANS